MKRLFAFVSLTLALAFGVAAPAVADVDDFHFDSFTGEYFLGADEAGHSTLRTVETLVAVFPEFDQNRGIRRELVDRYDGHPTELKVVSVTDEAGQPREWSSDSDGDFVVLTIAGDNYVHGQQTYVITYEQRFVTRYFADTGADEFYWDTNGTGWGQPFGSVTANVHIADELRKSLTGRVAGYAGYESSTDPATIVELPDGFSFSATNLQAGQNVTLAIAFEPGTFTPRPSGFTDSIWPALAAIGAALAVLAAAAAGFVRMRVLRDAPSRGLIIPEYLPPKGVNLFYSANTIRKVSRATAAELIKLAVDGNIRILEEERRGKFTLEFLHDDGLDKDEKSFINAIFEYKPAPGTRKKLKSSDSRAAKSILSLNGRVSKYMVEKGYRRKIPAMRVAWVVIAATLASLAGVVFSIMALDQDYGGRWPLLTLVVSVLAAAATYVLVAKSPLDAKGVELRDYLKGLHEYIDLAETDRLQFLQSPEGALRSRVSVDDPAQVVKLNERLLPYAVLFGEEKRWAQELGRYYEQTGSQPEWYSGASGFNAALFASSIGSVSSTASSSFSASSGGSGGGGSSGGGGGGGGGGGV